MRKIENGLLKLGGNTFNIWLGKQIEKNANLLATFGNEFATKNNPLLITNPSAKLVNPFTLLINFTVNPNQKYQVILQGNYKDKYKESEDGVPNISEDEMFMIISETKKIWFKKE